jgi:thioredoxin 1
VLIRIASVFFVIAALVMVTSPLCRAQAANSPVLQLEAWRKAVLAGDSAALTSIYTESARILGPGQTPSNLQNELNYWASWKGRGLTNLATEIEAQKEPQPGFHVLVVQLGLSVAESGGTKKYFVKVAQIYSEQGAAWKIVTEQRDAETRLKGPAEKKDLYPAGVDAQKEISEALATAAKSHKRVLLIFGGNWCYDCHVLDEAFHTPEIAPTLNRNFVVAHIDIGEYNKNLEIAKKYEVPLERGVPAAAVLESDGRLLFSQKNQEFEKARSLAPEDILAFLKNWKPASGR